MWTLSAVRRGSGLGLIAVTLAVVAMSIAAFAQTTISTGSIQGTITDPSGAVVGGAKITISNKATGQRITVPTTSAGAYTSGALIPGDYVVRAEAAGFQTSELAVTVEVGVTSSGNMKLQVGQASQVVEVQGSELQVNTEQATVQGVLNTEQIENLPINGRNFLDLAQLEPGVQIQDGGNFDPTKKGFSSISFGGRFGRTARIEVDGVDISDETVGTTTQDIPAGAIQEFQIGESMLDLSTELTSSGSVNVTTKSGTNSYHGQAYYLFRDQSLDSDLPGASHTPFQRNQFGGNFGGAILPNKLFFFLDGERTKQDFQQPVEPGPPFQNLTGSYSAPFREFDGISRVDYNIRNNMKVFYRFSYDQNSDVASFESIAFQPLNNTTHTRDHVVGLDFTTGGYTHSIRFGYMKFFNHISSGTTASTPFNPTSPIELAIGPDLPCINTSGVTPDIFCSGQGFLAPQSTPQSDHQVKYDGSKAVGSHILRYGFGFNHIQGGGFAGFLADGAAVQTANTNCPGNNPLNCTADFVLISNGQGYSTNEPALGFPAGGLGPDNRISWYIGDSWKVRPNFTVTYGLRYVRDTGRTDSDLGPIPVLNQFGAGLGNRVSQPNLNFAPQLGIAWDPSHQGKTVIRAGIGLFYENSIWNNALFDRPERLTQGRFLQTALACNGGAPGSVPFSTNINLAAVCGQPIGQVQSQIAALQSQFQATAASGGTTAPNGNYIGTTLADTGPNGNGDTPFAPDYKTPRSVQMNFGIQHEFHKGTVFTADFLRNVGTHSLLVVDTNHVGDVRYFNMNAALNAINRTLQQNAPGCLPAGGVTPGAVSQGAIRCYLASVPTASIADFASAKFDASGVPLSGGLDSGYDGLGGGPAAHVCDPTGITCLMPDTGAAFAGINPNVGGNQMLFPIGRSVYNGLQMSLKQNLQNPFKGVRYLNLQVSYALSKYVSQAEDGDFINSAWDYANPGKYIGWNGLDRKHQLSFGGTVDLPAHFRASVISHFYSPLPQTLTLPLTGTGDTYRTAVNGDGTGDGNAASGSNSVGGILPGTTLGSFGRDITPGNINQAIANYNNNYAGKPTPAGQVLITNNLFTLSQLQSLNAVMPQISPAPPNEAGMGWLRATDFGLNWIYSIKERVQLEPGVTFFNVMNFANFDPAKNTLSGVLNGQAGSANGTPGQQPNSLRVGLGSGVFGLGSPRVVEFSLKLTF